MKTAHSRGPMLVVLGMGVLLVVALVRLFQLRFTSGDVYPPYSSLRSDPLGTRILYDAMANAGLETGRNFHDVKRGPLGDGTIYLCGAAWNDFDEATVGDWGALLAKIDAGARLVVAFVPAEPRKENFAETMRDANRSRRHHARHSRQDTQEKDVPESEKLLAKTIGVSSRWLPMPHDTRTLPTAKRMVNGTAFPEDLPWHTALSFETTDPAWHRMYSVADYGAIIERDYGRGTIVLVGDNFLLSNEAMQAARAPGLLSWLQGGSTRAVFDESHLGVAENTGVATLARGYGLAHAAIVLLAVALLFIWKNASSLVPPGAGAGGAGDEEFAGRESSEGFVALLRRTIPADRIFSTALAEYRKSSSWRRLSDGARQSLNALDTPLAAGDPLTATIEAHRALKKRF